MILRVIGHQLLTKLIRRNHICGEITQLGILCLNLRVLNLSGSGWEEGNVIGTPLFTLLIELHLYCSHECDVGRRIHTARNKRTAT